MTMAFMSAARGEVVEVDYSFLSPIGDEEGPPGFQPYWDYGNDIAGLTMGLVFENGPHVPGDRSYFVQGFYRTAKTEFFSYTEGSAGAGARVVMGRLGAAYWLLGGSVRYSRFWFKDNEQGTHRIGGSFAFVPGVQVAVPLGQRFEVTATARGLLYTNLPEPHGLAFPYKSGVTLSAGCSIRL